LAGWAHAAVEVQATTVAQAQFHRHRGRYGGRVGFIEDQRFIYGAELSSRAAGCAIAVAKARA